ncbi:MAG: hypothetical protein IJU84_06250, partial [Clostridia bacterium]|nr:hypothetical protein [Clostridia bacterium]
MDKRIISEWNKISEYGIFDNIDEFAKLFKINPNGSCYKKYSNYEWSKENFFFGTYKELLDFYRTSTEIPFYLNKSIGSKYGQLQIKSFNVKICKNKRVYYAVCICDCGRECEKEYSKIAEGHITTCGNHKQQHKTDLLSNYKDIVERNWDYTKNKVSPENVSIHSNQSFWWIDETGSFLMKPSELQRKSFGTSFNEQCLYFYLSKIFKNVSSRKKISCSNKKYEVDIYLDDYQIAIEYDGVFWHKDKLIKDIVKTQE